MKENSFVYPEYQGLKRRCDFCEHPFHVREKLAACQVTIEGAAVPYVLIFCFKGRGDMSDQHCLHNWCADYGVSADKIPVFEVMKFKGRDRRDDTGGSLAYV